MLEFSEVGSPACVGLVLSLQGQTEDLGSEFHTNVSEFSVFFHPSPHCYGWNPGQASAIF